jgi:hypothetical protein
MDQFYCVLIAFEYVDQEELDAAVTDAYGGSRAFVGISAMQKTVLEFSLVDQIGGFVVRIDKHPDAMRIALLGPFAHACRLQGPHGLVVVVFWS